MRNIQKKERSKFSSDNIMLSVNGRLTGLFFLTIKCPEIYLLRYKSFRFGSIQSSKRTFYYFKQAVYKTELY